MEFSKNTVKSSEDRSESTVKSALVTHSVEVETAKVAHTKTTETKIAEPKTSQTQNAKTQTAETKNAEVAEGASSDKNAVGESCREPLLRGLGNFEDLGNAVVMAAEISTKLPVEQPVYGTVKASVENEVHTVKPGLGKDVESGIETSKISDLTADLPKGALGSLASLGQNFSRQASVQVYASEPNQFSEQGSVLGQDQYSKSAQILEPAQASELGQATVQAQALGQTRTLESVLAFEQAQSLERGHILDQAKVLELSSLISKDVLKILLQDQTKVHLQRISKHLSQTMSLAHEAPQVSCYGDSSSSYPVNAQAHSQLTPPEFQTECQSTSQPQAQDKVKVKVNPTAWTQVQSLTQVQSQPQVQRLEQLQVKTLEQDQAQVLNSRFGQAHSMAQVQASDSAQPLIQAQAQAPVSALAQAGNWESTNIFWATSDYASLGKGYQYDDPILPQLITKEHLGVIRPRVMKLKSMQSARSRNMAEVFTPAWICNAQNNLIDAQWFGREHVFNIPYTQNGQHGWRTIEGKIEFPSANTDASGKAGRDAKSGVYVAHVNEVHKPEEQSKPAQARMSYELGQSLESGMISRDDKQNRPGKTWQDYVMDVRLEVTCGEAPYLVSRYDASSGQLIPLKDRIGLLDRKLRVVSENTTTPKAWFTWAMKAYQSLYAYEWQGDSLFLARVSLFLSFIEYFEAKFGKAPAHAWLKEIAKVISWNVWQMDGLKGVIPDSCQQSQEVTEFLGVAGSNGLLGLDDLQNDRTMLAESTVGGCQGCLNHELYAHNGVYCLIKDWFAIPEKSISTDSISSDSILADSGSSYSSSGSGSVEPYSGKSSSVRAGLSELSLGGASGELRSSKSSVSALASGLEAQAETDSDSADIGASTGASIGAGAGVDIGSGAGASIGVGIGAGVGRGSDVWSGYARGKVSESSGMSASLAGAIVRFVDVFTR